MDILENQELIRKVTLYIFIVPVILFLIVFHLYGFDEVQSSFHILDVIKIAPRTSSPTPAGADKTCKECLQKDIRDKDDKNIKNYSSPGITPDKVCPPTISPENSGENPSSCDLNKTNCKKQAIPSKEELFMAFDNRDYELAAKLAKMNPELIKSKSEDGTPILVRAIRSNQDDLVRLFISMGEDPNVQDGNGTTALCNAVDYNSVKIVKSLLDNGALIDNERGKQESPNGFNEHPMGPPLHIAICKHKNYEMTKLLISRGADVNLKDYDDNTAFYLAVANDDSKIAFFLVDKGAEVNTKNSCDRTPLHVVSDLKLARYLVSHGLDVNARDLWRGTALHLTLHDRCSSEEAYSLKRDLICLYLSKGADVNAKDYMGTTPLHYAAMTGNAKLVRLLLSKGAKVDVADSYGGMPVNYAIRNLDLVSFLVLLRAHLLQNRLICFIFLSVLLLTFVFAYRKFFMKKNKAITE